MKIKFITVQLFSLCGLYFALIDISHAELSLNQIIQSQNSCEAESIQNAIVCGQVSGRLNTLYYSTHDAYFVKNLNQDTAATGGFLKYETKAISGLKAGVSYAAQWRLDDKNAGHAEVGELSQDKDGLAETYLDWNRDNWSVRIGQQGLNIPFVGNYDWRVMPPLFRAVDVKYEKQNDFIQATWIDRFKSYADDEFFKSSKYSSSIETNGMWSIGASKSIDLNAGQTLRAEAWYQSYDDYNRLAYVEGHWSWKDLPFSPDLGVQAMWSEAQGKALAGKVDHQGYGIALALNVFDGMTLKTGYNYIKPDRDSYLNGALFAPYMIYTASGPYFAQPFFTSTQDLGAGHAAMVTLEGALNEQTYVGANYSFMNLAESEFVKNLNQSEYVIYGIYNFKGVFKGWSLADFFGYATSPRSNDIFVQNRLALKYSF
ncbi:hypothetical protein [Acinetobacter lanii]|uniref:OprD family porin n=1 Tax=Acinetobacter lanii TaxID=2715163 RepID=A0A6G8S5I8_9GAMM|nr:hypothetical protein [Acinetobacter lanii]QIO09412.1 hypothetical protein G8D99_10530 [Acinetobacter lanii]